MDRDYKQQARDTLSAADFDKHALPDIQGFSLPSGDTPTRLQALLDYVHNPYLYRVGDIGVHVAFSGESGDTLQSHMQHLLDPGL